MKATCGEDFCEVCGECLECYAGDACLDDGEHTWPKQLYADRRPVIVGECDDTGPAAGSR